MLFLLFKFLVAMAMSAAWVALGLVMIFRPDLYLRWVRWSNVERYAPWLHTKTDVYSWPSRLLGVWFALFGVFVAVVSVYILWFQ
jgi:hypothetical protein